MTTKPSMWLWRMLCGLVLLAGLLPAAAHAQEPPPVLILPANRATFLPGARFDVRVEVHSATLPDDFTVTVNGDDATDFFGAEPVAESWVFGDEEEQQPAQAILWREVTLAASGVYTVEVTAGGGTTSSVWTALPVQAGAGARNVILFIADGLSIPMLTAARAVSRGYEDGKLTSAFAVDQMPEVGLVHTNALDSIITDSAASASAYNTGHKANGNALATYSDTSPDTLDDPRVETFAELIKRLRGMSVGIVTTTDLSDATPAAVYGHTRDRDDREVLAAQPLDAGLLPEVMLGGGSGYMLPSAAGGSRSDERDLLAEYALAGYTVVTDTTGLEEVMLEPPQRLLGLFHPADMSTWLDRNLYTDNLGEWTDQPGLETMTLAALNVLGANPNGFYLMVEAGNVDKQMHAMDAARVFAEIIEFDNAVATAIAWSAENAPDTLIVVTADHGQGYDVFGTVDVGALNAAASNDERRAAIHTYSSAGFPSYADADGDYFPDTWTPSVVLAGLANNGPDASEDFQANPELRVPALEVEEDFVVDNPDDDPGGIRMTGTLPRDHDTGVHTMQDVPIFAVGPGAEAFGGVLENTDVFFAMAYAIGLDPSSESGIAPEGAAAGEVNECGGILYGDTCFVR